ncbi:VWA domain-containing protein [bacterium]|nr:VWA domain-containing protein [bacterium]
MNDSNRSVTGHGLDDTLLTATDRELLAARITAYALGDLDAAEAREIERMLAEPDRADERRQVEEVRLVAAALEAGIPEAEGTRSADLRRAVLAGATAARPTRSEDPSEMTFPTVARPPWRVSWGLLTALGSLAAAMLVAATLFVVRREERMVAVRQSAARSQEESAREAALADNAAPQDAFAKSAFRERSSRPAPAAPASPAASAVAEEESLKFDFEEFGFDKSEPGAADMAFAVEGALAASDVAARRIVGMPAPRMAPDRDGTEMLAHGEGYATVTESRFVAPRERPLSTFSIDVDTASYANVRRFLVGGHRPPRDAVRIEEFVNYFRYAYPQPQGDVPFSVTVDAAECPWKPGHRLVRIGLQGRDIDRTARPAGNLVFLVDVSGSMQAPNKLALVQQALAMLVEELSENDRVSIVTYAGNAGLVLPPTTGDQKQRILAAVDALEAGGSTHGSAGIALAYEQAREHFIPGGSNRVILATDGDLNVGVTNTTALIDLIKEKAASGTFLTVLGFGEGNLQDEKMEALADNGNGVYAYIDGVREARKVLVEQLTGSTVTIAKDVKIQVEFNPAQVASYRLLGYENRALAARDFRDDKKDAGEIGAGHSVTALYEVVLVGDEQAAGGGAEPLKYQPQPEAKEPVRAATNASLELLTVKLRWKRPDGDTSTLLEVPLAERGPAFDAAPADLRFAAAVAAFGMILRESGARGDATLPLVAKIAAAALGRDEGGYRAEFLDLVRRAESLR